MQAKQKVTLYLSPELHRRLKIRAAINSEPMSELAEKALVFYLAHPEVVNEAEASHGQNHRVYACPECTTAVALRDGEMVSLKNQAGIITEEQIPLEQVSPVGTNQEGEEELVPC